KKFVKSTSFSPKLNGSNTPTAGVEKLADTKSAPSSPAPSDQIAKPAPVNGGITLQSTSKLFSYKEVALAPPGTIVKAVAEQPPKGNPNVEQNSEVSPILIAKKEIHSNVGAPNDIEENVQNSVDENVQESFHGEEKEKEVVVVAVDAEILKSNEVRELQEANNDVGEKQEVIEGGKEQTKKLSAAAPPFNPSTIPIFGSVPVP
ncbi:clustered mitochondria protein-like, partial [Trifolium medium]|nr:clustered mitochondria protein-like [Trifolium medium]